MDAELRELDEKIRKLADLCQRLRSENLQLRQELAAARNDNKHLADRMGLARTRIEGLIARFPADT